MYIITNVYTRWFPGFESNLWELVAPGEDMVLYTTVVQTSNQS